MSKIIYRKVRTAPGTGDNNGGGGTTPPGGNTGNDD